MVKDGILQESLTFLDHCETYGKELRAREEAVAIEGANSANNGETTILMMELKLCQ